MRLLATLLTCAALCGCVNCYTRFPTTDMRIKSCYQSTLIAASLAEVCSFPQVMSDNPSDYGFSPINLLTIPFLGLPCAADAVCEAAIDTACLPFDWPISVKRKRDQEAWQEERRREYEANRKKEEEEVN